MTTEHQYVMRLCPGCNTEKRARDFNGGNAKVCITCHLNRSDERHEKHVDQHLDRVAERGLKGQINRKMNAASKYNAKTEIRARREKKREELKGVIAEERRARRIVKSNKSKAHVAERELAARELARRHLMPFVIRNKKDYMAGWVHKDICRRLEQFVQDIADKKSPRLILMMPPRSGKSELGSVQLPAWALGKYPEWDIIATSHTSSLAEDFSKQVRDILRSDSFKVTFPDSGMHKDNQNASGWSTAKDGGLLPAGVGGPIVGHGAHMLIIDDPVKNAIEAESETTREMIWNWYTSTAYTRLAPGGGVLIIMQRWMDDDLSGRLERLGKLGQGDVFEIVRYPAIAEVDEKYRRKGQPLHPERYDLDALNRIKRAVGDRVWEALYQQNPVAAEGDYFRESMFRRYTTKPERLTIYVAWDLAIGKKETNDWTVGVVIGVDEHDHLWVLDLRRGHWNTFEIVEQMLDVHRTWKPEATGIEKGHLSMAIGPYLNKRIQEEKMYDMIPQELLPGRRDKSLRARSIQGRMHQGMVFFPLDIEAEWMSVLKNEMMRFPNGVHDDCVDAMAWIGLMLEEMDAPMKPRVDPDAKYKTGWRKRLAQYVHTHRHGGSAMTA